MTSVNAALNTACFLTFKRLRRTVNQGVVGAVAWLLKCSISFLNFFVASTYTNIHCS